MRTGPGRGGGGGAAMDGTSDVRGATRAERPGPEAASLRLLRVLVTTLTVVMIAGIVAVVALLVIRMPSAEDLTAAPVPEALTLPDGTTPIAFTRGRDWFAVVTDDDRILIYRADGTLRREVRLSPEPD